MWSNRLDNDDVQFGSAAQRFNTILQAHVLKGFIGSGEAKKNDLRIFINNSLLKMEAMPEVYFADGTCLRTL